MRPLCTFFVSLLTSLCEVFTSLSKIFRVQGQSRQANIIKTLSFVLVVWSSFVVLQASSAFAASSINNQINYQARLSDASGFPVADGSYSVYLSLYDASMGGTRLWTATGTTIVPTPLTVNVQNGLFTVLLGDTSPSGGSQNSLDTVDWNSDQIYLGVTINADAEMSPRKRFASAPQAFNARQLQGMYASSTAASGQTLFTLNQTQNDAALSARSTLDVRSSGTSNSNDFLIRGVNDTNTVVFSINRQGSVTTTNVFVSGLTSSTNLNANIATFATANVSGSLNVTGTTNFVLTATSTPIIISAPAPQAFDYTSVLSYSTTGTEGLLLANYNIFGSVNNTILQFTKDLSDPFNVAGSRISYANEFNTLSLGITGSSTSNGTLLELFDNDYMTPGFSGDAAMVLRKYTNAATSSMLHLWNLGSNGHDVTVNVGSADPVGVVNGNTGSIYFRNSSTSGTQAYLNNGGTSATWVGIATVDMIGSGGPEADTLASVTNRGATTSATLSLYGGFVAASSSVTGTLNVVGTSTLLGNAYVGTSTYSVPLNTLFSLSGDDLYVQGNIGSVSSVYTNGAFVAGTGTTMFGDGFIQRNNGGINVSSTGDFNIDVGANSIVLGTLSAFINFAGRLGSDILPDLNNTRSIGDPAIALANLYSVNVSSTSLNTNELTVTQRLSVPARVPNAAVGSVALAGSGLGSGYSVAVQGNFAFVGNAGNDSLDILDVTIPSLPSFVTSVAAGLDPVSVAVDGNYAYLLNQNGDSLFIYDVTNPINPVLLSSVTTSNDPVDVKIQGKYAYVFSQSASTLEVYDISNPLQPLLVSSIATIASPAAGFVQGRYAYIVGFFSGMEVIDLANPALPVSIGTTSTGNGSIDIAVQGQYAYVINNIDSTLQIFNVVDPANLQVVGVTSTVAGPYGLAIEGRNVYVTANSGNSLELFDVNNPLAPTSLGAVSTGIGPTGLFVYGRHVAVVANGSDQLEIFETSDAQIQQIQIGSMDVASIFARGDYRGTNSFLSGGLSVAQSGRFNGGISVSGTTKLMQDVYVGTSTYSVPLNALFSLSGDDLYVQGNIGSVSSVYTNGAFVAGTGTTMFGDGFIESTQNDFSYGSASSHNFYANGNLIASFAQNNTQINSYKDIGGTGGNIQIDAASGGPFTNFSGGSVDVSAGSGDGSGAGGQLLFYGGDGGSMGNGGDVTIAAGDNGTTGLRGGHVSITGGDAVGSGLGGSIFLTPGRGTSLGNVILEPNSALTQSTNLLFREANAVSAVGLRAPNALAGSVNFILPGADGASSTVIGTDGFGNLSFVSVCLADGSNCPSSATPTMSLVGSYDTAVFENFTDVAVANNIMYAIVGSTPPRMDVLDISNPSSPVLLRSITISIGSYNLRVIGDRLFISSSSAGIRVYDITEPTFPVFYGFVTVPSGFPGKFYVSGDRLYLANGGAPSTLQIYSLASNNPTLLGTYTSSTSINSVFTVGDIAYIAHSSDGLSIIDVSNPAAPVRLGGIDTNTTGSTNDVFVSGNYAYLADGTEGIKIVNITTSTSPTLVGSYDPLVGFAATTDIYAAGNFVYFNAFEQGFYVADISNPAAPTLVQNIPGYPLVVNFDMAGTYAYLAVDFDGIRIYDMKGTKLSSANIDFLKTSKIDVDGTVNISNDLSVHGGLSVGFGGIRSLGTFSTVGTSTFRGNAYVGTSTNSVSLNSQFSLSGDDLYVQGNIGSVSSVYTNGAFFAGTGTTMFGDGFIRSNNGGINVSSTGDFNIDVGANSIVLGTSSAFINFAGRLISDIVPNANNSRNLGSSLIAFSNLFSVNVSSTNVSSTSISAGNIFINSGTAANPSYSFAGDVDTGMYRSAANTLRFSTNGSIGLTIDSQQRVGIGVNTLTNFLQVASSTATATVSVVNTAASAATTWGAYIDQLSVGSNTNATGADNYSMVLTYASSATFGGLCLDDTGTAATCPTSVSGTSIMADGAVNANAFDLAELYHVTGTYDIGDVLTLYSSSTATVQTSPGIPYDSKVIGVVSENPGFLLGWGEGAKVALTGRVPVKISMNNGSIQVGDALVSSDVPGYAMKATKPGMVLGYALESSSATGTVEIFLSQGYWAGLAFGPDGSIQVDDSGNVSVMNDLMIGGRLFPSLKGGGIQTDWYLFVNADDPTSTYISTNADGWMSMDTYDFAERYYSPDELEAGDLVIVSHSGKTHVQRSLNEDDMLLGIVSTRPAFIAGRPATSTYPIALSGRVPTKVSGINGAIKAGDPLAPTSIPGVAAKAVRSGPIIGLALEDFDMANIDKIEVYVNPSYWVNEQESVAQGDLVASPAVISQAKQGFAKIVAGSNKVRIEFPSLGAYPNVQVTPRGSISGGWWTDSYSDTGFEIMLGATEDHDVVFAWRVEPTLATDVMRMSDGTYSVVDPLTGLPVNLSTTTTESVVEESVAQDSVPQVVQDPVPQTDEASTGSSTTDVVN